jgi:hypothetical protein
MQLKHQHKISRKWSHYYSTNMQSYLRSCTTIFSYRTPMRTRPVAFFVQFDWHVEDVRDFFPTITLGRFPDGRHYSASPTQDFEYRVIAIRARRTSDIIKCNGSRNFIYKAFSSIVQKLVGVNGTVKQSTSGATTS